VTRERRRRTPGGTSLNYRTIVWLLLSTLFFSADLAAAETVARWVDADGITHFGDAQLAPSHAELEIIEATNGMEAPEIRSSGTAATGPTWSLIPLPPKKNPKGWRGKGEGVRPGLIQHN